MLHNFLEISQSGLVTGLGPAVESRSSVRRQLTPLEGRALEMLGHAIEYLADEYCADGETKGCFGNADPRIEAIQMLKARNREIYYGAAELPPAFTRIKQWIMGSEPV